MTTCEINKTISNKTVTECLSRPILSPTIEQFQHLMLSGHAVEIENCFKYLGTELNSVYRSYASNPKVFLK